MFSCKLCQSTRRVAPIFVIFREVIDHLKTAHGDGKTSHDDGKTASSVTSNSSTSVTSSDPKASSNVTSNSSNSVTSFDPNLLSNVTSTSFVEPQMSNIVFPHDLRRAKCRSCGQASSFLINYWFQFFVSIIIIWNSR